VRRRRLVIGTPGRYTETVPLREPTVLVAMLAVVYTVSGWSPADRPTWWMEVAPVFVVLPVILWTQARVRFTPIVLRLLAFEAVLVAIGAHYTYSEVPLGRWVSDLIGWERNHYDRFGHFMQGIVPALAFRELLLKTSPLGRGKWMFAIVLSICLALSVGYEFLEWWAAVMFADGATAFLGTQGDAWDAQWDMFLALVGAILSQMLLAGVQDHQMDHQMAAEGKRFP
jgi:putative membrane protein